MNTETTTKNDWILVTGQPGCGKTTAVQKMVSLLEDAGMHCKGFYTQEVRENQNGPRIGFDVVTVPDGRQGVLARKGGPKQWPKTGPYSVDVASFEQLALSSLQMNDTSDNTNIVYVLDEIGRMELHSKEFPNRVRSMLDRGVRLVGAVTAPRYGHRVPFCDEVTALPGLQVHNLTKKNREEVVSRLLEDIQTRWISNNGNS